MTSRTGLVPLAILLTAALSGCAGSPGEAPPAGESVTVVTDPTQGRLDPTMGEHLHDYWGGQDRKLVVAETVPVGYFALGGGDGDAAVVLPDPGDVVPQGTASVEVTMTWTPDPLIGATNYVEGARLAVRTAADREPRDLGPVENGATVVVPSTNEQNDLPHQVLSAWEFHWVLEQLPVAEPFGFVAFQGELQVRVEAVRGLEIPLYPGHPDQWQGRTEIGLFAAEGMAIMDGDTRSDDLRCYSSCPGLFVPGDGVVVPIDASHIRVTLDRDAPSPTRLGLAYHTAISRDWQMPAPIEETPTSRVYVVDVLDGGDGAYTKQSNWEFALFVEDPVENGYIADTYRVAATVYKTP